MILNAPQMHLISNLAPKINRMALIVKLRGELCFFFDSMMIPRWLSLCYNVLAFHASALGQTSILGLAFFLIFVGFATVQTYAAKFYNERDPSLNSSLLATLYGASQEKEITLCVPPCSMSSLFDPQYIYFASFFECCMSCYAQACLQWHVS